MISWSPSSCTQNEERQKIQIKIKILNKKIDFHWPMSQTKKLWQLSATETLKLFKSKEISPVEVAKSILER
jgi:hypothetical protein